MIELPDARSIADTYNAKWLEPDEVARTFVPPSQFVQLAKRRNTLVVGPRGSGKTTLLKMLTGSALSKWETQDGHVHRSRVNYTGVFIATDVSWNSQVMSLGRSHLDATGNHVLQMAALTAHTQKALIDAIELRATQRVEQLQWSVDAARRAEVALTRELARQWHLNPEVPSFYSLMASLRRRLQSLFEIAEEIRGLDAPAARRALARHRFLHIQILLACRSTVEQFNDVYREKGRYWAFLFDELELMAQSMREVLYTFLRTFPGPLVFKLALSPFDEALPAYSTSDSPQRDQDFDFIPLWYAKKRKAYSFCRALWKGLIRGTSLEGQTPEQAFGHSLLDTDTTAWNKYSSAYTKESRHYRYLRDFESSDETFRRYLRQHKIDLDHIEDIKATDRAASLRKVFPLVVARLEQTRLKQGRPDGGPGELRSRKISAIYTGATSIFDISEGNPRLFIGLVGRMLDRVKAADKRVDLSVQTDEITQAINRFRALLRTIIVPQVAPSAFKDGLLSLLDPIGQRIQKLALVAPFSPEPPGTFFVDGAMGVETVRLLGYALNAGAIVFVPEGDGEECLLSNDSLGGKRFRLSYLLAAHYGVPPRLGRGISLSELLHPKGVEGDLFEAGR